MKSSEYKIPGRSLGSCLQGGFFSIIPPLMATGEKGQRLGTRAAAIGTQ